jgi:hypothetical protein
MTAIWIKILYICGTLFLMERIAKSELLVNIHFSNLSIRRVNELYLFYRLRVYASSHGGAIDGFNFSSHEKYRLLPELKRIGWVKDNRVVNYRALCNRLEAVGIWVRMPYSVLESLKAFKGFLIAASEAYILRRNNRLQERKSIVYEKKSHTFEKKDWVSRHGSAFWLKVKKIDLDDVSCTIGRVYVSTLEKLMGLDKRTISRWREESLNEYRTKYLTPGNMKSFRDQSMYFYSNKSGSLVTIDQYIISDLDLFTISKYNGIEYTYSVRNILRKNTKIENRKNRKKKEQQSTNPLHYYKTEMQNA